MRSRRSTRSSPFELTAKGARRLGEWPGEAWRRAAAALPPADMATAERVLAEALRGLQRENGGRTFGQCRSCRHLLRPSETTFRCGLTREALRPPETLEICHHHSPGDARA